MANYLTLNLDCRDDPQIVEDAYNNDIDAVKKKIEDGVCVDSFGTGLVSVIKGYNLTNFEYHWFLFLLHYRHLEGYTALARAVFNKNGEMGDLLLQRGALVDARGSAAAGTPLMYAAWTGNLDMVKRFVEDHHADPSLKIQATGKSYYE